VHVVLDIGGDIYRAGWQRKSWLIEIAAAAPPLGELFQETTGHLATLTILRLLRNSIHGEALSALAVGEGRRRDRTLVGLPSQQQADLLAAIAALGGEAMWGVEQLIPGRMHADPGMLIEQLLPRVLRMLNEIMDATPVERLRGVSLSQDHLRPPVRPFPDTFHELNRQSIRWQLGL
jgi:hypothetical protein